MSELPIFLSFWILYGIVHISTVVYDVRLRVLPNIGVFALTIFAIIWLCSVAKGCIIENFLVAAVVFMFLWFIGEIYYRKTGKDGLGIGDAKLFGAGAVLLGPSLVPQMILLASAGGIIAVTLRGMRTGSYRDPIPFGPFMSGAIILLCLKAPHFQP